MNSLKISSFLMFFENSQDFVPRPALLAFGV